MLGRDAFTRRSVLRRIAAAGHEIASHGFSHPEGFSRADDAALDAELVDSRVALESALDAPVRGFRAPNWDLDARVASRIARAGYEYDASLLPTPFLLAARLAVAAKARDPRSLRRAALLPASLRRLPYRWTTSSGPILEFPVSVTPILRMPIYHTLRYRTSDERFTAYATTLAGRGEPLCYPLHAIDVLGPGDPGVHPALRAHPGMDLDAQAKCDLVRRTLAVITEHFEPRCYRELLPERA